MKPAIRIVLSSVLMFWVVARCPAQVPMDENKDLFTPRGATAKPAKPPKNAKEAFEPTLVTLRCDHMSPREAVDELSLELGYPLQPRFINFAAPETGDVTVHASKQPYWVVVRDMCNAASVQVIPEVAWSRAPFSLALRSVTPNQCLYLCKRQSASVVPAIRGIYFPTKTLPDGTESKATDRVRVSMALLAEPKVFIASFSEPTISRVADHADKDLAIERYTAPPPPGPHGAVPYVPPSANALHGPNDNDAQYSGRSSIVHEWNIVPKAASKSIKVLKGTIGMNLGFDTVTKDVSAALEGKATEMRLPNGRTIVFKSFSYDEVTHSFKLIYNVPIFHGAGEDFTRSIYLTSARLEVTDEHDRPFVRLGGLIKPSDDSRFEQVGVYFLPPLGFQIPNGKPPVAKKLIFTMASRIERVVLPFEFNDIPLPESK